jgi:hypothetical protein
MACSMLDLVLPFFDAFFTFMLTIHASKRLLLHL